MAERNPDVNGDPNITEFPPGERWARLEREAYKISGRFGCLYRDTMEMLDRQGAAIHPYLVFCHLRRHNPVVQRNQELLMDSRDDVYGSASSSSSAEDIEEMQRNICLQGC